MALKLPQIIGHRGAAGYAPENTLEGIHTAADMDVAWVELDVKLTKDEVPVLFHDDTLDRTTNGSGPLAEITLEDLRDLECGSWFGESFAGVKVPTFEEALEVLIDRGLGFAMEIKPCPGRAAATAEAALDILSQVWDDHERLLISSFSQEVLETAMNMAPGWARGLLLGEDWPDNWADLARDLSVSCIAFDGRLAKEEHVQSILAAGLPALAYTINDPDRAHLLQRWGVSGVFSNEPDEVREGLLSVH